MTRTSIALLSLVIALPTLGMAEDEKVSQRVFLSVDKLPAGSTCDVAILLEVDEGWHVYANPVAANWQIPTKLTVKSANGTKLLQTLYPAGESMTFQGDQISVYEGRVLLFATLSIPAGAAGGSEELTFEVKYQACNDSTCLAPATVSKPGKIPVTAPGERANSVNPKIFALKQAIAESGTVIR